MALRLGDLLALLVEEELVGEVDRRPAAEDAADLRRQPDGVDQVLARHLVAALEREPAHCPVGLPLPLAPAPGDRTLALLAALVPAADGSGVEVVRSTVSRET